MSEGNVRGMFGELSGECSGEGSYGRPGNVQGKRPANIRGECSGERNVRGKRPENVRAGNILGKRPVNVRGNGGLSGNNVEGTFRGMLGETFGECTGECSGGGERSLRWMSGGTYGGLSVGNVQGMFGRRPGNVWETSGG